VITAIVIFWALCSILSYGISLAYWQREFKSLAERDYVKDTIESAAFSLFGPLSLFLGYFLTHKAKHGLMYTNPHSRG